MLKAHKPPGYWERIMGWGTVLFLIYLAGLVIAVVWKLLAG